MTHYTLQTQTAQTKAEAMLRNFCLQFPEISVPAETTLIEAGRQSEVFYFVVDGCVKMSSTSSLGDKVTLHVFYPDSCFPLLGYVLDENRFDFETAIDSTLCKVPVDKMTAFIQENIDVALLMNLKLLKGLNGLLHRIEQSVFVSAYYQVAGMLNYFARHFGQTEADGTLISTRMTHKDISEWLGLSRENVSLQMKQLERDGVIGRRGQNIIVRDLDELTRLASPQDLLL